MKVLNALQIKKGAKTEGRAVSASLTQPLQFISAKKNWTLLKKKLMKIKKI